MSVAVFWVFTVSILHCVRVCTVQILKCIDTIVTWPKVNFNHLRKESCWALCSNMKGLFFFPTSLDVSLSGVAFQTVTMKLESCYGPHGDWTGLVIRYVVTRSASTHSVFWRRSAVHQLCKLTSNKESAGEKKYAGLLFISLSFINSAAPLPRW